MAWAQAFVRDVADPLRAHREPALRPQERLRTDIEPDLDEAWNKRRIAQVRAPQCTEGPRQDTGLADPVRSTALVLGRIDLHEPPWEWRTRVLSSPVSRHACGTYVLRGAGPRRIGGLMSNDKATTRAARCTRSPRMCVVGRRLGVAWPGRDGVARLICSRAWGSCRCTGGVVLAAGRRVYGR